AQTAGLQQSVYHALTLNARQALGGQSHSTNGCALSHRRTAEVVSQTGLQDCSTETSRG
ncbi:hypothetical protein SARC_16588, partial [Sphaeroforma arctica JP610]